MAQRRGIMQLEANSLHSLPQNNIIRWSSSNSCWTVVSVFLTDCRNSQWILTALSWLSVALRNPHLYYTNSHDIPLWPKMPLLSLLWQKRLKCTCGLAVSVHLMQFFWLQFCFLYVLWLFRHFLLNYLCFYESITMECIEQMFISCARLLLR